MTGVSPPRDSAETGPPTPGVKGAGGGVVRDSAALLVGTLVNGLFAYIFFAQATRGLGAAAAAPVAVLWTYWGVATAVITFPVQHWIIRALRSDGEERVAAALPRMTLVVVAFAAAATLVTWLVDEQLFTQPGVIFPVLIGCVTLGTFFTGVVRGGLAGQERFTATGLALAADNVVRVVLAFIVLRYGGGAVALGVVLVIGAFVGVVWPAGYRFRRGSEGLTGESGLGFLGSVASSSLLGQLILVGGPAVLAFLGGGAREVTMLFATLAFFRAPYLLAVGIANRVTGTLTGWVRAEQRQRLRQFQVVVAGTTIAGSAVAAVAASAVGPALVGAVFGADTVPPRLVAAVVAAASTIAVGNLALSLLAIAQGRGDRLTIGWVAASLVVVVVLAAGGMAPTAGVAWAFLAGEAAAFFIVLVAGWRVRPRSNASMDGATMRPGAL